MEDNFIVAIELGSSKVTCMAGRKQPDGAIQVLAFAQEPSTTFIRKGRINNVSKMTQCLISMKDKMEQKLQKSISRVYVGIGGMGMHTVAKSVVRHFDSKVEITQEMIDAMYEENRNSANADHDILDVVPQEYHIGTQVTNDPVGIMADNVEANFLNVVANSSIREEIRNCFRAAGVTIAELPITVETLADAMLTEPEKRSGCVFVDMGAETTSVAIYKNNLLRHLAVIPLGGANINRDIMSLQIEDDEAEELKIKYGSAIPTSEGEAHKVITLRDGRTISYEDFSALVEARVEEIILNIQHQIALSKYEKAQLIGGLIVTGGASYMKNINKAFVQELKFEKIRFVRTIRIPLRSSDYPGLNSDGDCNAAIALIDKGNENCCGGRLGQPNDLFDGIDEEKHTDPEEEKEEAEEKKRIEEEAKRLLEREAKKKAEEEERRKAEEERKKARVNRFKNFFKKTGDFFSNIVKENDDNA